MRAIAALSIVMFSALSASSATRLAPRASRAATGAIRGRVDVRENCRAKNRCRSHSRSREDRSSSARENALVCDARTRISATCDASKFLPASIASALAAISAATATSATTTAAWQPSSQRPDDHLAVRDRWLRSEKPRRRAILIAGITLNRQPAITAAASAVSTTPGVTPKL